jgi:hypothetical protein
VDLNATKSVLDGDLVSNNFTGLGVWNQVDLYGNIAIPSDCGEAMAGKSPAFAFGLCSYSG